MRRPHLVPLSIKALDLLIELKTPYGNYKYVFLDVTTRASL